MVKLVRRHLLPAMDKNCKIVPEAKLLVPQCHNRVHLRSVYSRV